MRMFKIARRSGSGATVLLAALLLSGCATTGTGEAERTSRNEITRAEIVATDVSTAYELVERLRPQWLVPRGRPSFNTPSLGILVYQDSYRMGGVEVLRQIPVEDLHSLTYLDGPTASSTLSGIGSGHVAGAIVLSRQPPR
jgi:hypothetical protein